MSKRLLRLILTGLALTATVWFGAGCGAAASSPSRKPRCDALPCIPATDSEAMTPSATSVLSARAKNSRTRVTMPK